MKRKSLLSWLFLSLGFLCFGLKGHSQGLEDVIVEEYYVTNGTEVDGIPAGLTTYRVYVDMAPGYEAQIIFGFTTPETIDDNLGNVIEFATTTEFYNSQFGNTFGEGINPALFPVFQSSALDTYVTMGAAATGQIGVLKSEDTNGSLLSSFTNVPSDGIAPSVQDGMMPGSPVTTGTLGLDTSPLSFNGSGNLFSYDGNWYNLDGASNPENENKVLIGQFTTDGEFSFQFSIQILLPGGPGSGAEVYSPVNAILPTGQVTTIFPALKYPQDAPVLGCTSGTACNFDPAANTDDGSCIEPVADCTTCENGEAVIVDSDGDGICNADEVAGCTSETACNFNPNATDDNFTCLEPIEGCLECNEDNTDLNFIDADGDGVCDTDDSCPDLFGQVGDACDDNNLNTENDVLTEDCICVGTPVVAAFNGSVNWNSSCADRDAIVTFYTPNTNTVAASYVATVNSAGDFTIPDVLVGTYDVIVNVPGYLNVGLADVVTVVGSNDEDFGTIIGGDVNNNNVINILDISLANNAFNTAVGNPNYILFADVNCSGTINILDVSAINFGFALGGATAPLP